MAITFVNKGAFQSGTGALTVPVPANYAAGDLLILMIESANQAITAISGWTEVTNSPQFTGTAAAAGGVRLTVLYKIATASEASVSVADSGDHTTAIMTCWRGVSPTRPFDITAGGVNASATTSLSCPGLTTTQNGAMIINAIALDADVASTDHLSSWANTDLVSIIEGHDQTVIAGAGGGIGFGYGIKTTAGAVKSTTVTGATSTTHAYLTMALNPIIAISGAISQTSAFYGLTQFISRFIGSISQAQALAFNGKKNTNELGAVSQSQTLTGTQRKGAPQSGSVSQTSTLSGTDRKASRTIGSVSQSSSLYGLLTKIAETFEKFISGSITVVSSFASSIKKVAKSNGSVSQGSSLTGATVKKTSELGAISQSSSLSGTSRKSAKANGSITSPFQAFGATLKKVGICGQVTVVSTFYLVIRTVAIIYEFVISGSITVASSLSGTIRKSVQSVGSVVQTSAVYGSIMKAGRAIGAIIRSATLQVHLIKTINFIKKDKSTVMKRSTYKTDIQILNSHVSKINRDLDPSISSSKEVGITNRNEVIKK